MKFLLLVGLLTVIQVLQVHGQDDYCYGKDKEQPQTRHFNSKTAYQIIKGTNIDKQYLVPGCEPSKIWILHRHGTRLPSKTTISRVPRLEELRDEIVKNYRILKTKPDTNALCPEDLLALQVWRWNTSITEDKESFLTSQGFDDMRGTAKLYQKYFPTVLPHDYKRSHFLFRHSATQRTMESFKAFTEGLFGSDDIAQPEPSPQEDLLLRPYDYCEPWKQRNVKGPGTEPYKYVTSAYYNSTLTDISTRLGFRYTLEAADIELMYDICRYEQAWKLDRNSAWCVAFTPAQIGVFEYSEDLKYYNKLGYADEDNARMSCHAVKDMLENLNDENEPKAIAYFAHSVAIQTLVTALGINKDDTALTASNYNEMADRRWKTSEMDPFAANFVAVKYECPAEVTEKEKVIFFLNQNAVDLDWCKVGLCNWSDVMKRYDHIYKADCNAYYCRGGASIMALSFASFLLAAVFYLIR